MPRAGDEGPAAALVIDNGTGMIKWGYAGSTEAEDYLLSWYHSLPSLGGPTGWGRLGSAGDLRESAARLRANYVEQVDEWGLHLFGAEG